MSKILDTICNILEPNPIDQEKIGEQLDEDEEFLECLGKDLRPHSNLQPKGPWCSISIPETNLYLHKKFGIKKRDLDVICESINNYIYNEQSYYQFICSDKSPYEIYLVRR